MKKNQNRNKIDNKTRIILVVLTILCITSLGFSFVSKYNFTYFTRVANYVLAPMQKGLSNVTTVATDFIGNFSTKQKLIQENEELKAKLSAINLDNNRLESEVKELARLRKQLKLNKVFDKMDMVGTKIIAKDPGNWFNVVTIDKGSKDGIKPDMNVVADGALVGIVTLVNPNSSIVRTIIDDISAVSSVVEGSNNLIIVEGNLKTMRDGYLPAKDIDIKSKISVGNKIVTSSVSDKFLPDIAIGYISNIKEDKNLLKKDIKISPIVNFNTLREVIVIKKLKQGEKSDE